MVNRLTHWSKQQIAIAFNKGATIKFFVTAEYDALIMHYSYTKTPIAESTTTKILSHSVDHNKEKLYTLLGQAQAYLQWLQNNNDRSATREKLLRNRL